VHVAEVRHRSARADAEAVMPENANVPSGATRSAGTAVPFLRRIPFTTTVLVLILVIGAVTGSLWTPIADRTWFGDVAYGLPSLIDGAWWTPVTGSFLALSPVFYVPVLASFAVFVGFTERRLGTRRTFLICVAGQLVAVLASAGTLLALRFNSWAWAESLETARDAGFSAGALTCIGVATATMRPPWRLRIRAGLGVYVIVSFLFLGTLADLEHLWAVALALPLGRRLVGSQAGAGTDGARPLSRREWRLLAATGLALIGLAEVVLLLVSAHGPLGGVGGAKASVGGVVVDVLVIVLILDGLRKGRRWAWWCGIVLGALNAAAALAIAVGALSGAEGTAIAVTAGLLWLAELGVLGVGRRAFRAPSRRRLGRRMRVDRTDREIVVDLLARHGGGSLSWMATWPDKSYFRTPDGDSVVAYEHHAGVAIALGDPIGPPDRRAAAVSAFAAMCEHTGSVPCFFSVTTTTAALAAVLGWQHVRVADDTIIDLDGLEFRGRKWQDIRSSLNRATKEGISYREVTLAEQPWAVRAQVRAISQQWVGDKGLPEMGFTLGGVDEALDPAVRVGLAVDADGSVHGVTSWLPVFAPGGAVRGWTLDVTRRRNDGFRPVSEFLIASACLSFQAQGAEFVSLSGAPLARTDISEHPPAVERLLDSLGAVMEPHYGFRSLHAFKSKFSPRYEPLFLAYRDDGDLPRIGIALTKAYLPEAGVRDLMKLAGGRA
jgi:phosphatidylglycerol lysyltransferase